MKNLDIFRLSAIRSAKEVFKRGWFDRAAVRRMLAALDAEWFSNMEAVKIMSALGPFHCVNIEDLTTDEIEAIEEAVLELKRILA